MIELENLGISEVARRRIFPEFTFQFTAQQLCFLCKCLSETMSIDGNMAEIGCEYGQTTVFLNNYIDDLGLSHKKYFSIDTFSGFSEADVTFEVEGRSKRKDFYKGFSENRKEWYERTMEINKVRRVDVIEADINEFDLHSLGPLSFALLDVDLYRPTKKALPELYELLSPGGVLVVDDCDSSNYFWDGAYQAYIEFVESRGITPRIIYKKLGVIRKTA